MAQPVVVATAANRPRIKLKLGARKAPAALGTCHGSSTGIDQLAELHAAVEAFCLQGVHGLPGAALLSPWREPEPMLPEQQVAVSATPGSKRRVRKRRNPDAADEAFWAWSAEQQQQLPQWGQAKRRRSAQPARAPRDAAQLAHSVHSMLQPPQQPQQQPLQQQRPQPVPEPQPRRTPSPACQPQPQPPPAQARAAEQPKPERQQPAKPRPAAGGAAPAAEQQQPVREPSPLAAARPAAAAAKSEPKPQAPASKPAAGAAAAAAGAAAKPGASPAAAAKPEPGPAAEPPPLAAAAAAAKPDSPPSEASHQQPIGAAAPQHVQALQQQPALMPVEQTAVSRDRSQCSLPRAAEPATAAADSTPAPAAAAAAVAAALAAAPPSAAAAAPPSGRLLELAPGCMTPAAAALAALGPVPDVRLRAVPPDDRPLRSQEEALAYLASHMERAKQLKHTGDRRSQSLGGWDVFGLCHYALSSVEFLLYWDAAHRLLKQLRGAGAPAERLAGQIAQLSGAGFLRQTGALCSMAMTSASNCRGPDVAKQALRMLLERLGAICHLRHLHSQRATLQGHIRRLRGAGAPGAARPAGGQQQQQQQVVVRGGGAAAAAQPAAQQRGGKPPSPNSSSHSPLGGGQHAFNKRSPDDSNASNQERVQLAGAGGGGGGGAGLAAAQERALALAKSERALLECMQELLRMTDGMHQTVMRMQQFLESPDVLGSEHARAAALHISVLGLDAGMYSLPRVAAHTEAAVTSITKLLRRS